MTGRYVALGSSMAAGPGIPPRDRAAPLRAGRSAGNYPHLVAQRLGLDLVDVTYSAATTAHVLTDRQHDQPPQADALDGSEVLVTVTIGGNDVGYIPLLTAAALPRAARAIPVLGGRLRDLLDPTASRPGTRRGCRVTEEGRKDPPGAGAESASAVRRLPDVVAAARRGHRAAVGRGRRARPPRRGHPRAADVGSRRRDRLRTGAGVGCQPRASRLVGGTLDDQADEIRSADTWPSRPGAPECRGYACGG